jgi:hypothetical protein
MQGRLTQQQRPRNLLVAVGLFRYPFASEGETSLRSLVDGARHVKIAPIGFLSRFDSLTSDVAEGLMTRLPSKWQTATMRTQRSPIRYAML